MSNIMKQLDAVIVGAGFAGIYMLHTARKLGLTARVFEAGAGPGGTWYWNRYPGARCDVESMQYSYQFDADLEQEWEWTERYAAQPEILTYIDHIVDRFDLARDIQLNTRVNAATFDEGNGHWIVETSDGEQYTSEFCILATGCLSSTNLPDFKGKDSFNGPIYHTGEWPHDGVDFTDLKVGIIGTGSSAVQSIPLIAEQAEQLTVFQRTPAFTVPAHNRRLSAAEQAEHKAAYPMHRARAKTQPLAWDTQHNEQLAADLTPQEIRVECERRWEMGGLFWYGAFADLLITQETNDTVSDFIRAKIHAMVTDPVVADLLTPRTVFGCKRVCADTDYYATYNRDNVHLVDISQTPIEEFTPHGISLGGKEYASDAIISATGFDAMTGSLDKIDIRGRGGLTLKDKWAAGPRTYLGLQSAGFPNLFIISGPGSPSVLTSMITSIEQHVEFIRDAITHLRDNKLRFIEATRAAEDTWVAHVNEVADGTLLTSCNSWYLGANVPGKPRVFMPYLGFPTYVAKCEEVVKEGYEGFALSAA
jgi:cation diffusion facilitator CzcD-associated flavoprotein CzcO